MNEQDCHTLFSKGDPKKSMEAKEDTLELTKRLQILNSEIESREIEVSHIKQTIMSELGDAETLTYQGKVLATWKAPKSSFRLDGKRLEAEHPELASAYKVAVEQ